MISWELSMCRATCAAHLGQREAAVLPSGETGGNKVRSGGTLHARPAEILRDAGTGQTREQEKAWSMSAERRWPSLARPTSLHSSICWNEVGMKGLEGC
ncbi:hypothetical protein K456DRAFT_481594 [Colletotrichum gloeosporioides 23]|nr:hypothetical protein K456DRAFT_481594 [Colletotrichum gloeosporioides 23]